MGQLDVRIRHGSGGGPGPVIALIALVALAAAGGAAHEALSSAVHVLAIVLDVILWTLGSAVILAAAAGVTYAAVRIRRAVLTARASRAVPPPVITVTPEDPATRYLPDRAGRPAIEAPRTTGSWPLPGWWEEVRPLIGGDDEHRR
jgi:hypothetical protein